MPPITPKSCPLRIAIAVTLAPLVALADESPGDPAAVEHAATLETVTVTAQKVTEDLQKTAAAVTALPGDALVSAGAYDIRAVQNLMPSVRF